MSTTMAPSGWFSCSFFLQPLATSTCLFFSIYLYVVVYLKVAVCVFFLYLIVFYEPPNIHNLALVGLYSMMFAFLLSLNFNIWQFATKHICYSNIYTTYIAIYVTSQQKNGIKLKNKQQQNKNKTKNSLQNGSEGAARVITKFGTEKSVHESAVWEMWLCNWKKDGLQTLFPTTEDTVPTVYCFKFIFSSFCKMAYRRISGNEVVHTSVHEIYTVHWVESRFSARKGNDEKRKEEKQTKKKQKKNPKTTDQPF